MAEENVRSNQIPTAMSLELYQAERAEVSKSLDEELKIRRKREFVLIILCLLSVIYSYPVQDFSKNPTIDIPSISLKIPLRDAIAVFPTIITAIYLVFLSSSIKQAVSITRMIDLNRALEEFHETGKLPKIHRFNRGAYFGMLRYIFLPSPLHHRGFSHLHGVSSVSRVIVEGFVGFVFTAIPFGTCSFLLLKSWSLFNSKLIITWNILCLSVIVLAFISSVFQMKSD